MRAASAAQNSLAEFQKESKEIRRGETFWKHRESKTFLHSKTVNWMHLMSSETH